VAVLLCAALGTARAQEAQVLTLDEALAMARERNPAYRQALHRLDAAGATSRAGLGGFLPTISLGTSWGGYSAQRVTGEDDFGRPVSLPAAFDFRGSSANQSVNASLTLFDGLGNLHTLRAARASEAELAAAADLEARRLEAETSRLFYEAMRTKRVVALEERLLEDRRQQLANTERLFRAAGATQDDVLGAQADVANQELELDRARGEASKALLALKEQIGFEDERAIDVEGALPPVFDPAALDINRLTSVALSTHPAVFQLDAAARAADRRAAAARGDRWPSVQLNASFSRSMSLSSYEALFEVNPQNRTFSFGINVNWPIFTGFRTSQQVAQADLAARAADEDRRAGRLRLENQVRSAYIDLVNARRALDLAERSAALSSERLRLARERYAIAAIDFTVLQQVVLAASQAERAFLQATFGFARAVVALDEAVGTRIRP
jgi:outer membrane protein